MSGTVNIHGKQYKTVALRVSEFREAYKEWGIETELVHNQDNVVIIKAKILNPEGRVIGTGYAEEIRGSTQINRTSALENCETSAIGRALASCGLAGEEYASANEVQNAISQQAEKKVMERYINLGNMIQKHWDSIAFIKSELAAGNLDGAAEAFGEIPEDERMMLNVARTKGGIWTKEETELFKSDEWSAARKATYENQ